MTIMGYRARVEAAVADELVAVGRSAFPKRQISHARLQTFFESQAAARPDHCAVDIAGGPLTYAQLEARANQLARALHLRGVQPGDRVGILLRRSAETYISLLAVLKAGAAFVPMDVAFPADRIAYMAVDSSLALIITTSDLAESLGEPPCRQFLIDRETALLAEQLATRPDLDAGEDANCYVIYTSGSTGRPKGVAVNHSSICHFIEGCAAIYRYTPDDRVYQGMTIAFDFSIEEVWPTLAAGATLVPAPLDASSRLGEFLVERKVTVVCCVPTLLGLIDRDVPTLRILNLGGENVPPELARRWVKSGRRVLNTYGPTEATVTATWSEITTERPVTIGRAMPGYRIYVLNETQQPVLPGEAGEIVIAGPGVAVGYLNQPELTATRFLPDPFFLSPEWAKNASRERMYRTGDMGRINADGDLEYLGRFDSEVKVRGYRVELGEIEAILLEDLAVADAVVTVRDQELVGYIKSSLPFESQPALRHSLVAQMRERLPAYMVPAYLEFVDQIPTAPSGKKDRGRLPAPISGRIALHDGAMVEPDTDLERRLESEWRAFFHLDSVSVEADFFLDLGGHSLLAARLVSRLREQPGFGRLSIRDLYAHPTIRQFAAAIEATAFDEAASPAVAAPARAPRRANDGEVVRSGWMQMGLLYLLLVAIGLPLSLVVAWSERLTNPMADLALWLVAVPFGLLSAQLLVPVLAKWLVIGRFQAGDYPVWGAYYCRWWLVRRAMKLAPLEAMSGSPFLAPYLRLLGARIGNDVHLGSAELTTPDLLTIGNHVHIGYGAQLQPAVVENGWLRLAPVAIGDTAFIGTNALILPGTTIGEGARVGEQTLVGMNQSIPAGESWSGSPAARTAAVDPLLEQMEQKPSRELWPTGLLVAYAICFLFLQVLPLALAALGALIARQLAGGSLIRAMLFAPLGALLFVVLSNLTLGLLQRLVIGAITPGLHPRKSWTGLAKWWSDRVIHLSRELTDSLWGTLYGVPLLRLFGARVGHSTEVTTVSRFDPTLLTLGDECFVADQASVGTATFHHGWIALARTEVGSRSFIGNASAIRGGTRTEPGSLIGVHTLAPREGVRAGSAWLGSPAMYLPKRQETAKFDDRLTFRPSPKLIAARLGVELFRATLPATLLLAMGFGVSDLAVALLPTVGWAGLIAITPALFLVGGLAVTLIVAALKWLLMGQYRPRVEPLWSPFVWTTELVTGVYEAAAVGVLLDMMTGTPMLPPLLRLFGAKIGKRVFLDSTFMTEFDLVHIGDDASIGHMTSLQSHLFEDRVMKMSTVEVGAGATIGPRSVVLYDTAIETGASLDGLSLVMKGESIPAGSHWSGIPARAIC